MKIFSFYLFGAIWSQSVTNTVQLDYNQQPEGFHCNFDNGLCNDWLHSDDGQFHWTVVKDRTPSPYTGPDHDNTLKTDQGGYLLMEASGQGFLHKALIYSPEFNISTHRDFCFNFWYITYGKHVFSLTLYSTIPPLVSGTLIKL